MSLPTLVLVDGRNLFSDLRECFGSNHARRFDIQRLAAVAAERAGVPRELDIRVHVGPGNPNAVDAEPEFARLWQSLISDLKRRHVAVVRGDTRVEWRHVCGKCGRAATCQSCRTVVGRLVQAEKGVDVKLAVDATIRLMSGDYGAFMLFSQDADFKPMFGQLVHDAKIAVPLVNPYPVCDRDHAGGRHQHSGVPLPDKSQVRRVALSVRDL